MDGPTMQWLTRTLRPEETAGAAVLEVGAMNVNGSIRPHVQASAPACYVGVDIAVGPGVDQVVSVHELVDRFGHASQDVVVSTEMLEHVEDWHSAIVQLKAVLRPGGLLVLTTRAPGFPLHAYPHDHWRFTPKILRAAFADFEVLRCRRLAGRGVAIKARKPNPGAAQAVPAPAKAWRWFDQRVFYAAIALRGHRPVVACDGACMWHLERSCACFRGMPAEMAATKPWASLASRRGGGQ